MAMLKPGLHWSARRPVCRNRRRAWVAAVLHSVQSGVDRIGPPVVVTLPGQVVCGRPTREAHRPARRWWQRLVPRRRSSVEEAAGQRPVLGLIELLKESGLELVRVERPALEPYEVGCCATP
jgi:hypothetical protein